ncbi:MAG: ABC transporter permease [Lachnospiraceae bacterium]
MINSTLYLREMKKSIKILLIFAAIITMYVCIIIGMYDPKMMETLDSFYEIMPEIMAAVGMSAGAASLLGFMVSYLYGFILLVFPMVFCILRGNGLISKYTDSGAMAVLVAAPVKRRTIVLTQLAVLLSGVCLLIFYVTGLELVFANSKFPGELDSVELIQLNTALLFLQLFIAGICFLSSCLFSETKYSIAFGAGIPAFMYVLQMLSNVGEKAEAAKYFTFFTLFDAGKIAAGDAGAFSCSIVLLIGAIAMFTSGAVIFCKKDLCV